MAMNTDIRLSQAYSMGKEVRKAEFVNSKTYLHVPGPGNYKPSDRQTKGQIEPSWSAGKDVRDKRFKGYGPGPGAYNIPSLVADGPKFTTRVKPFIDPFKMKTDPGPGHYEPEKASKKIMYSMNAKNDMRVDQRKQNPAPGQYENADKQHYSTIPGSKMGRDMRKQQFLKTPAHDKPDPSRYDIHGFTKKSSAPKYSFGSSTRERDYFIKKMSAHPGPNHYEQGTTMGKGVPRYSMPDRGTDHRPKLGKDAPGSGQYNPEYIYVKNKIKSYSISKGKRDGEINIYKNTPGSGHYHPNASNNLVRAKSASWRIGTEMRPKQQQYVPETPGPGAYEQGSTLQGPKFCVGARSKTAIKQSPGPGTYQQDQHAVKTTAARYSLGKEKRTMLKELNAFPGPGAHDNKSQLKGPKFGFGTSSRAALKPDGTPGPGQYGFIAEVGHVPAYSMPAKATF